MVHRIPNTRVLFETPVSVTPAAPVAFVNGVWTGPIQIHEAWTDLFLRADDGNGRIVYTKAIPYTDFPAEGITLWFVNHTILLPSEY